MTYVAPRPRCVGCIAVYYAGYHQNGVFKLSLILPGVLPRTREGIVKFVHFEVGQITDSYP